MTIFWPYILFIYHKIVLRGGRGVNQMITLDHQGGGGGWPNDHKWSLGGGQGSEKGWNMIAGYLNSPWLYSSNVLLLLIVWSLNNNVLTACLLINDKIFIKKFLNSFRMQTKQFLLQLARPGEPKSCNVKVKKEEERNFRRNKVAR